MSRKAEIVLKISLVMLALLGLFYFLVRPHLGRDKGDGDNLTVSDTSVSISESSKDNSKTSVSTETPSVEPEPEPSVPADPGPDPGVAEDGDKSYKDWIDTEEFRLLGNYDVVFIGDSIFADNDGPESIPSYFGYYTGARVYNMSKSGMCAVLGTAGWLSCPEAAEAFISLSPVEDFETEIIDREIKRYESDDHTDKGLVVILDCCINDYTMASPLTGGDDNNFKSSVINTINRLREGYPWVRIVYMIPHYYSGFEGGTELNALNNIQTDYFDMIYQCQAEIGFNIADVRSKCGIDASNESLYIRDGVHPNSDGCKVIGKTLADEVTHLLGFR